jgi:hypothetical protein
MRALVSQGAANNEAMCVLPRYMYFKTPIVCHEAVAVIGRARHCDVYTIDQLFTVEER